MYQAPQTPDGRILAVDAASGRGLRVEVGFPVPGAFRDLVKGREDEIVFAARSRIARLGINVAPTTALTWEAGQLHLAAEVTANVSAYDIEDLLPDVLLPGVRVGRLVFCPDELRLSSEEIDRALLDNELQLPAAYSIDHEGKFRIRPEGHIYGLSEKITRASLTAIVSRADGKDLLNRIQVRRPVDRIVLPPHDGVITSCSMFLHTHFVVLESQAGPLGQHLEAVVLDPVRTRGTNVFLEFSNASDRPIVNPAVAAAVYRAADIPEEPRRWFFAGDPERIEGGESDYARLAALFDRLESRSEDGRYSHRLVAVADDVETLLDGGDPLVVWRRPDEDRAPAAGADASAPDPELTLPDDSEHSYGTVVLDRVPEEAGATLLLGYFPNLVEHTQICAAAMAGKVKRLVFRRASYEHGSFLSARDHGRLADLEALGVEVFWCNDERRHVVTHVFRGLRGYFMEPKDVERFRSALIFAVYGSARLLTEEEEAKVRRLLERLREFFGNDIAILTGGGPGAMQQATNIAHEMGMMVGASFIETVDQETNQTAEFYQTFQGRSRQARQRWFEVASFHLFFMGGVGTLEEVGLTLTDMKLGVIELSPLVFFGRHEGQRYWMKLREQFRTMVDAERAPPWLMSHLLMTDDPEEVPEFYKRILELG
jgi:predicted Rossmann-fold nucleotide-binding protein